MCPGCRRLIDEKVKIALPARVKETCNNYLCNLIKTELIIAYFSKVSQ